MPQSVSHKTSDDVYKREEITFNNATVVKVPKTSLVNEHLMSQ